jgi:hypothetical protein
MGKGYEDESIMQDWGGRRQSELFSFFSRIPYWALHLTGGVCIAKLLKCSDHMFQLSHGLTNSQIIIEYTCQQLLKADCQMLEVSLMKVIVLKGTCFK